MVLYRSLSESVSFWSMALARSLSALAIETLKNLSVIWPLLAPSKEKHCLV